VGVPDLFEIDTTSTSAKLNFTTLRSDVTGYAISYGFTETEERFGADIYYNGPKWIIDTTINYLSPNTTYYFRVKPLNGCNGGSPSKTFKVKTGSGQQKMSFYENILSRIQSVTSNMLGQSATIAGCQYTVLRGDSLWSISSRKYGAGSKYPQIIDLNSNISSTHIIYAGQNLTLCQ
jgi:LysM repeat protein